MTAPQLTLDLFGDHDWAAQFDRAEVTIDQDLQGFTQGQTHLAWRCPGCGDIELTPYSLWINHGFDPNCRDASRPFGNACWRQDRRGDR